MDCPPIDIVRSYVYAAKSDNIPVKKAMSMGSGPQKAAVDEIKNCLRFDTWEGYDFRQDFQRSVRRQQLEKKLRQKVYSMMFLRMKRSKEWKARLVTGGNRQDLSIYSQSDKSSPTVTTSGVFMLAAIAATKGHSIMSLDITGAYLYCDVKEDIVMVLDPIVSQILIDIDAEYERFKDSSGRVWVKLKRALYGLVESARLFYDNLSSTLLRNGFSMNAYDPCVFVRTIDNREQYICFHVDDLFCTASDPYLNEQLYCELLQAYPDSVKRTDTSKPFDYLEMIFDFYSQPGSVVISQQAYVAEVLMSDPVQGDAATPADDDLFKVDSSSDPLPDDGRELLYYHSENGTT